MRLNVLKETTTRVPVTSLRKLFEVVVRNEAAASWRAQVNVVFITDHRMRRLNREYRGKDKPTDVLSFNIDDPESSSAIFGEVYISVHTAVRQANELGHSLSEEFMRLACHGFMHLFGYDHQADREAEKMEALERTYLTRAMGK
ncbi:MAG: rRNA maturation RNase YbeY [candidate division Zixibacteria bacterium]|nr:rRNA maturation RNase YbeY [candidate division Zixibacteria bacterium]